MTMLRVVLCFTLGVVFGYLAACVLTWRELLLAATAYLIYRLTRGNRRTTP